MAPFPAFKGKFVVTDRVEGAAPSAPRDLPTNVSDGFAELMTELAGSTFDHGVYRLHTAASSRRAASAMFHAFPTIRGVAFGFDWLGRQTVLSPAGVLLAEPGTGQILETEATFRDFHEVELVEHTDSALADEFFRDWRRAHAEHPLGFSECVGYRIPLYLGGRDVLDNLEVVDVESYWDLSAQLISQVRNLPPGGTVGRVSIRDQ